MIWGLQIPAGEKMGVVKVRGEGSFEPAGGFQGSIHAITRFNGTNRLTVV